MSSTNRGGQRHPDDFYATPAWCTRAILPHVINPNIGIALDPACGDGAILDVVREDFQAVRTYGIEIDQDRADACVARGHRVVAADALAPTSRWVGELIVMNPPFALAMPFVERAIGAGVRTVACLLRLAFLSSQKRAAFWRAHPADVYVLPKRPSFTGQGTDSADYAWFVWGPGRGGRWSVLDVGAAKGGER